MLPAPAMLVAHHHHHLQQQRHCSSPPPAAAGCRPAAAALPALVAPRVAGRVVPACTGHRQTTHTRHRVWAAQHVTAHSTQHNTPAAQPRHQTTTGGDCRTALQAISQRRQWSDNACMICKEGWEGPCLQPVQKRLELCFTSRK